MSRNRPRTDLALIAAALTYAETHSNYQTAKHFGIQATTLRRWQLRQMREPNGWPTPADIQAWQTDDTKNATERRLRADQVARYRNRTYIARGPLWTDSVGTVRRLRALIALGWVQTDLAHHLGTSSQYVSLLTTGRHPKVHIDTAAAIRVLYDQLSMTVPTIRPGWVHDRQRRYAAARGWAPPLAWDRIDDPRMGPQGVENKVA